MGRLSRLVDCPICGECEDYLDFIEMQSPEDGDLVDIAGRVFNADEFTTIEVCRKCADGLRAHGWMTQEEREENERAGYADPEFIEPDFDEIEQELDDDGK